LNDQSIHNRIQWRRDKVREYSILGFTQRDIASELKVSLRLVEKDLAYLRLKAKNNITHYINEYLPAEYENTLDGLNMIMRRAWSIHAYSGDDRTKLAALSLIKDCYDTKLELLSSATVVDRAVRFVEFHRSKLVPLHPTDQNLHPTDQNGEVRIVDDTNDATESR
jgi:hypothetical protein